MRPTRCSRCTALARPITSKPPVLATNQPTRAAAAPKAGAPAFQPRVGAFEIAVALHTPVGKFGPSVVFSKLETGRFPRHDKLAELMTLRVVELLAQRDRHRVRSPREVITEPANVPPPPPPVAATTRRTVQFGAVTTTTHRQPPAPPPPPSAEEGAWWPKLSPTKVEEGNLDWERMRQAALEAVKGLPPVEVPPRHALIVRFEYCIAERPGRNGSLRGSTITYAKHFEHLERHVLSLLPGVRILVNTPPPKVNHPPPPKAARRRPSLRPSPPRRSAHPHVHARPRRPMREAAYKPRTWGMQPPNEITEWISAKPKAPHRSAPSLPDKPYAPRIDAFEVSVMLQGPSEHATYGPMLVHSKLSTGHPRPRKGVTPSSPDGARMHRGGAEARRLRLLAEYLLYSADLRGALFKQDGDGRLTARGAARRRAAIRACDRVEPDKVAQCVAMIFVQHSTTE